jgi:hypothetical protein
MKHSKSITTAALLSIAAGLGAPILELGELRRKEAETDEERQARELAGIEKLRRMKAADDERVRLATEKRERKNAKRVSHMRTEA